jgi:hypothetical protein
MATNFMDTQLAWYVGTYKVPWTNVHMRYLKKTHTKEKPSLQNATNVRYQKKLTLKL